MPYDSMTGTRNTASSSAMTRCGRGAEQERMNRKGNRSMISLFFSATARIDWWIVGTAVYHVGRYSFIWSKKAETSKTLGQTTPAPAEIDESNTPTSP